MAHLSVYQHDQQVKALDQCQQFFAAIFDPGDIVEFRPLPPAKQQWTRADDIGEAIAEFQQLNAAGHNCHFGANPRTAAGGSKNEDVAGVRCLFVDFDGGASVEHARQQIDKAGLPTPTAVLTSGGGVHVYWRLDRPLERLADFKRLQQDLARAVGSDGSVNDLARLMRLPGFTNWKHAHKPLAALVDVDPARVYSLEQLRPTSRGMSTRAKAFLDSGTLIGDEGRRGSMFAVACDLRDHGWDAADAEAAIMRRMRTFDLTAEDLADAPRQIRNAWKRQPREITGQVASQDDSPRKVITFLDAIAQWDQHSSDPVVPTGLQPFDDATQGGLPRGALTGLVAPPGCGKSALALQLVLGALHQDPDLRAVYGLGEMMLRDVAARYAAVGAAIYGMPVVTMHEARNRDQRARDVLVRLGLDMGERLTFVESPLTTSAMRAEVERTGAKLLVVDFLQLVRGGGLSQVEQIDGIVDELQRLAVELDVAVVVISSMAKAAGQRTAAHEWGRGSASIGYSLALLYVAEVDEHENADGTIDIRWVCRKARSIERQDVDLVFDGGTQTFMPTIRPVEAFAGHAAEESER